MEEEEEIRGCDAVDHKIDSMLIHNNGRTSSFGPAKGKMFDNPAKENYHMGTMNVAIN